jgi:hypothetical protein
MEAVGSERATLLGSSEGGAMSLMFGATYPERMQALKGPLEPWTAIDGRGSARSSFDHRSEHVRVKVATSAQSPTRQRSQMRPARPDRA